MRHIFALTILITVTGSIYGQAPAASSQCSLKLAQSPAVRGIKLGMKLDQIVGLFPGSEENNYVKNNIANRQSFPNVGVISFGIAPSQHTTRNQFVGVESINFVFIDDHLVQYEVQYGWPFWPNIEDFVNKVADAFHLPQANEWDRAVPYRPVLLCDGFRLETFTRDGRATLVVRTADEPFEIQRERRAAFEAQARREFRP